MRRQDAVLVRRSLGEGGITLVEVAAGVTMLGIVVALVLPAIVRSSRFQKVVECQANLHVMYQAQAKAPAPKSNQLGIAYWTRLTESTPPLSKEALRCPVVEALDAPACMYLGPGEDPAKADAKDPIGCDLGSNHSNDGKEGGNVLLKSGEVVTDRTGIWASAIHYGKCRQ